MFYIAVLPHCRFLISGLLLSTPGTPPWFLRCVKVSNNSELYPGYIWLPGFPVTSYSHFITIFKVLRGLFYLNVFFLPCTPLPHVGLFVIQIQAGTPYPGSSMLAFIDLSLID